MASNNEDYSDIEIDQCTSVISDQNSDMKPNHARLGRSATATRPNPVITKDTSFKTTSFYSRKQKPDLKDKKIQSVMNENSLIIQDESDNQGILVNDSVLSDALKCDDNFSTSLLTPNYNLPNKNTSNNDNQRRLRSIRNLETVKYADLENNSDFSDISDSDEEFLPSKAVSSTPKKRSKGQYDNNKKIKRTKTELSTIVDNVERGGSQAEECDTHPPGDDETDRGSQPGNTSTSIPEDSTTCIPVNDDTNRDSQPGEPTTHPLVNNDSNRGSDVLSESRITEKPKYKKKTRIRSKNPALWFDNLRKLNKNSGKSYTYKSKKQFKSKEAKKVGPPCRCKKKMLRKIRPPIYQLYP